MPFTTHIIQPDILTRRTTRPVASAMAPTLISDWLHSQSARPEVETISRPLSEESVTSMLVTMRLKRWFFSVCSCSASRA